VRVSSSLFRYSGTARKGRQNPLKGTRNSARKLHLFFGGESWDQGLSWPIGADGPFHLMGLQRYLPASDQILGSRSLFRYVVMSKLPVIQPFPV